MASAFRIHRSDEERVVYLAGASGDEGGDAFSDAESDMGRAHSEPESSPEPAARPTKKARQTAFQPKDDIEDVVIGVDDDGTPIYLRHVASVALAPMVRQGAVTRDGRGEIVTGIVMMRMGANSREVVTAAKEALESTTEALAKSAQKLGEAMYAQAQAQAGAAGAEGEGAGAAKEGDEKVVDAEYTEVKDRK